MCHRFVQSKRVSRTQTVNFFRNLTSPTSEEFVSESIRFDESSYGYRKGSYQFVRVCDNPGGGVLPLWPNRGSSQFEGLTNWLPNGPFCQPHTTN